MFKLAENDAKRRVRQANGDVENKEWLLSMTNLEFGKYRGKNFLWLLENDVGYATMLMADHKRMRETCSRVGDAQWDNKEALFWYVCLSKCLYMVSSNSFSKKCFSCVLSYTEHFPEMQAAIKCRQQSNVAQDIATCSVPSTSGESEAYHLVGFGPYRLMSRFNLYHSTQDEHKRYVTSILKTNVTHPGGQLDKLKRYIEKQEKQEQLEDQLLVEAAEEAELHEETASAPAQLESVTVSLQSQESRAVDKVR